MALKPDFVASWSVLVVHGLLTTVNPRGGFFDRELTMLIFSVSGIQSKNRNPAISVLLVYTNTDWIQCKAMEPIASVRA